MVVNRDTNRGKTDGDALRARDIIPPYKPDPEKTSTRENTNVDAPQNAIPKFDLAEKIMAEQRKITASKRKAPENRNQINQENTKTQTGTTSVEMTLPKFPEPDPIVAEIVASDIQKICGGYHR